MGIFTLTNVSGFVSWFWSPILEIKAYKINHLSTPTFESGMALTGAFESGMALTCAFESGMALTRAFESGMLLTPTYCESKRVKISVNMKAFYLFITNYYLS